MKLGFMRLALGTALVGATLSAQALTLNLTGYAGGGSGINLQGSAPAFNTNAGAFVGSLTGPGAPTVNPFYTYCVELTQTFGFGSPLPGYSLVGGSTYFASVLPALPALATTVVDRLGKLFTVLGGANLPTDATQSAAIQLAVWESIYEGATFGNTFSGQGTSGAFSSTTNNAVRTSANALLASASALATSNYAVGVLKNNSQQDFIVVVRQPGGGDIPEPATWALAGLALAGLGVARRRRA